MIHVLSISAEFTYPCEHVIQTALGDTPVNNLEVLFQSFDLLEQSLSIKVFKWDLVHKLSVELPELERIR